MNSRKYDFCPWSGPANSYPNHLAVECPTAGGRRPIADGGKYDLPAPGDRVRDRDSDDGDELLVVETHPDTTAEDHRIDAIDATVADVNVDHPGDAPVVEAVYVDDLKPGDVTSREPRALRSDVAADRLRSYTFPSTRLAPVDPDDADDDTTPSPQGWGASDHDDHRDGRHAPDDEVASLGGGRGV